MIYPYIRDSVKFFGKFEVVINDNCIIPCYNLATARAIKKKLIDDKTIIDKLPGNKAHENYKKND